MLRIVVTTRARLRTFQPGDKVLVLLPMPGKPLHAKYHGPYSVEQQLGTVDYVTATPDRRKTKRVCHINLLKPYHDREPGLDLAVASIPVNVLLQLSVTECPAPTPYSRQLPVATKNATPQLRRRR